MQWFNRPQQFEWHEGSLVMQVTPQSDYWRKTHYGFIVDDGPFCYEMRGGEFEVSVKLMGEYQTRFDQMGLMFRIDEKTWIKTGVEFVEGKYHISTVHTVEYSSWSMIALDQSPEAVWMKAVRRIDAVEIFYSLDGVQYQLMNVAYFPDNKPIMVGMMAASPDGKGFKAKFEGFNIQHLADQRRLKWLTNQSI